MSIEEPIAPGIEKAVPTVLADVIRQVCKKDIPQNADLSALGLDSIVCAEICSGVEERLERLFPRLEGTRLADAVLEIIDELHGAEGGNVEALGIQITAKTKKLLAPK